jgi:hypothetical protein
MSEEKNEEEKNREEEKIIEEQHKREEQQIIGEQQKANHNDEIRLRVQSATEQGVVDRELQQQIQNLQNQQLQQRRQVPVFNYKNNYKAISDQIDDTYLDTATNNSNIIDIIDLYVKGQKILYTEAKTICEMRLSCLMLPSILFTVLSSIISLIVSAEYGKVISSSLNGAIAFILALINYLKLDARAEAHRVSAYKYDKLESYLSFQSGKQLFFVEAREDMGKIVTKIENDIKEIKETNQFVLPEIIRLTFPILTNINIFAEVKKINNDEMILKTELMFIANKILAYKHKPMQTLENQEIIDDLHDKENDKIKQIILLQKKYNEIDIDIKKEMKDYNEKMSKNIYNLFSCLKV